MPKTSIKISRRDAIKVLGAAAGASLLANLPSKWSKPELAAGVLPAHAQTSAALPTVVTVGFSFVSVSTFADVAYISGPRKATTLVDVQFHGKVTDDGGSPILANGFVWGNNSTNTSPTLADHSDSPAVVPVGTVFSANESVSLDCYARAYATNAEGTAYGAAVQIIFN